MDIFAISVEHHRSRVTLITSAYLHLVSSFSGQLLSYEAANFREKLFPSFIFVTSYQISDSKVLFYVNINNKIDGSEISDQFPTMTIFSSFSSYIIYGLIGSNSDTRLMTPTFRVIIVM